MASNVPPYLGSKISIISKSEIRYEGILYTVDAKDSTIALAKVKSFGTEGRPTERPLAPRDEVYEYIIFRASDIKDLHVCEPPRHGLLPHDPAIVQQSGPIMHHLTSSAYNTIYGLTGLQGFPSHMSSNYSNMQSSSSGHSGASRPTQRKSSTMDASVQVGSWEIARSNERMEPLRQRNQMNYPQRRRPTLTSARRNVLRRNQRSDNSNAENYNQEYDFEQANAEFQELENKLAKNFVDSSDEQTPTSEDQNSSYDKKKSFFDDISCEATQISKGLPRFDWRLERKLNVETFGVSANNAWLRRRRGRGAMRRGFGRNDYSRNSESSKTVTFNETPVVKEVDAVILEEPDKLPVIEVVADKEKSNWPELEPIKVDDGWQ